MRKRIIGIATITAPGVFQKIRGMAITIPKTGIIRMASRITRFCRRLSLKFEDSDIPIVH
jgi:hypothetical protein